MSQCYCCIDPVVSLWGEKERERGLEVWDNIVIFVHGVIPVPITELHTCYHYYYHHYYYVHLSICN